MSDTPRERTPRIDKEEGRLAGMTHREADRLARRIPWERLLHARQEYIELNAFNIWASGIIVAESNIPLSLAKALEERCPGLLGGEFGPEAGPQKSSLHKRMSESIEGHALAPPKDEGWLGAVAFHAVRDPVHLRDCAYGEYCEAQWKRQRPSAYPSFEEWRKCSEQCADEVLDSFEMKDETRQIIKALEALGPGRVAVAVDQYMEWEAFTYWLRSLLEADAKIPDAVRKQLECRCPGFLETDDELRRTLSPEAYTKRWKALLEWGEDRFFAEIRQQGWFDSIVQLARAHPRSARTVDYWVLYWDESWSKLPRDAYPSFESWRRAADDFVVESATK